jgi:hypothetical protein
MAWKLSTTLRGHQVPGREMASGYRIAIPVRLGCLVGLAVVNAAARRCPNEPHQSAGEADSAGLTR